jgi:hypothetical protein
MTGTEGAVTADRFTNFGPYDPRRTWSKRGRRGICEWYFASCENPATRSCTEHNDAFDVGSWDTSFCNEHARRALELGDPIGGGYGSVDDRLVRSRGEGEATCVRCFLILPARRVTDGICEDCTGET